jgi:hypothetical protein
MWRTKVPPHHPSPTTEAPDHLRGFFHFGNGTSKTVEIVVGNEKRDRRDKAAGVQYRS